MDMTMKSRHINQWKKELYMSKTLCLAVMMFCRMTLLKKKYSNMTSTQIQDPQNRTVSNLVLPLLLHLAAACNKKPKLIDNKLICNGQGIYLLARMDMTVPSYIETKNGM
uniref:Uncharacterized protein n=1 Tax=Arundo donax TaxID=35708 RepID=A0A0A9GK52_ARUDO